MTAKTSRILLGTHFMFNEELGSRLRGEGYTVHPFDSVEHLEKRLENEKYTNILVILDLQHEPVGGVQTVELIKSHNIPILALCEHKRKEVMKEAKQKGADLVITNSQASNAIEDHVKELLTH